MAGRWRTKSVEQSIADTDEPDTRLRKDLNWWDLTVFGVSVVIGAGIFTITASTAGNITGPAISISFVIAAVACGLAALCYAEFASTVPVAGSAYTFSYATFGEFIAWIIGWDLILEFAVAAAVVAKGWSSYLGTVFGFGGGTADFGGFQLDWGALLIIAFVTVILAWGTKLSAEVSLAITVIKVAVVLLVVVVGAFYIKAANFSPFIPPAEAGQGGTGAEQSLFSLMTGAEGSHYGWYGVLAGASIVFFAFIGFDIVATTAEETKNPQRDVSRGILASLAIVTVLYVAVAVVLSGMVSYTELRDAGEKANLATAFSRQRRGLGREGHLDRRAGRADHRRHRAGARPDPGVVRDVPRRAVAAPAGQDRPARHAGAHHPSRRCAGGHHGVGVPDRQARGDGQHRHAVRVRAGFGGGDRAAPHASGSRTRVPSAGGAAAADRSDRGLRMADAQPDRPDLDSVPHLDGDRRAGLFRIRPQAFRAGEPGGRRRLSVISA